MNSQPEKRVCLGKIATAHGVRGLVKVLVYAEDPALLSGVLYLGETSKDTLTLTMKNSMGKYWLAEVDGVSDRNAAELLRGTKLWTAREALPDTDDDDDFYIEDLIGLTAETADGKTAGKVIALDNFGAGDLLEIKPPVGDSVYIPFTKAEVPEILLDAGKIIITKMPDE